MNAKRTSSDQWPILGVDFLEKRSVKETLESVREHILGSPYSESLIEELDFQIERADRADRHRSAHINNKKRQYAEDLAAFGEMAYFGWCFFNPLHDEPIQQRIPPDWDPSFRYYRKPGNGHPVAESAFQRYAMRHNEEWKNWQYRGADDEDWKDLTEEPDWGHNRIFRRNPDRGAMQDLSDNEKEALEHAKYWAGWAKLSLEEDAVMRELGQLVSEWAPLAELLGDELCRRIKWCADERARRHRENHGSGSDKTKN